MRLSLRENILSELKVVSMKISLWTRSSLEMKSRDRDHILFRFIVGSLVSPQDIYSTCRKRADGTDKK